MAGIPTQVDSCPGSRKAISGSLDPDFHLYIRIAQATLSIKDIVKTICMIQTLHYKTRISALTVC